jgi:hypothetical protein
MLGCSSSEFLWFARIRSDLFVRGNGYGSFSTVRKGNLSERRSSLKGIVGKIEAVRAPGFNGVQ